MKKKKKRNMNDQQPRAEATENTTIDPTTQTSTPHDASQETTASASDDEATAETDTEQGRQETEADVVQQLGEKLAQLNDKYLRLYSEYENYRKHTRNEKADLILNGGRDVIKSVLPVIDDMERALQAMPDGDAAKEGVQLICNKMLTILSQKGLKPIEAVGEKFDESLHEAVTQVAAPTEAQKGTVIDVIEKGYFLNEKVLRYAKVVVGA